MTSEIIDPTPPDPVARPLLDALRADYTTHYREFRPEGTASICDGVMRDPTELFAPSEGALIVVVRDGELVGGGAFKRYDSTIVELKRARTHAGRCRQG